MADTDTDSIFFSGPIETAIGSAISRGLSLACFTADDGEESLRWEQEYMRDSEVLPLLQSQCVLLRLQAGSVEAGFLAAFCPIQAVPYLVIVKNGQLIANIVAGASREDFITGIKTALSDTPQAATGTSQPVANEPIQSPASTPLPESSPAPPPASTTNPAYAAALEARRTRLEAQHTEQEAADRAALAARNAARRESSAGTTDPPGRSGNMTYLEQQRKRQLAAQEERKRVLQLLENDKIERRQKEAKRKEAEQQASSSSSTLKENTPKPSTPRPTSKETAISFRLLDGSSLKSRFPSDSKLGTDVRTWLDSNRNDGDHPYSFLQILAPLPNKPLSLSDENSTLLELGLAPTATLVLVPAQTYTTAYTGGGTSNEVGLLGRAYGLVYGAVTTVLGVGYPSTPAVPIPPAPTPAAAPTPAPSATRNSPVGAGLGATLGRTGRSEVRGEPGQSMSRASSANGRIRTLYDGAEEGSGSEEGRKYYNGNQLDFEPKRDEKGKDRKE